MSGGSIFISYRREDSAGEAGRLAEHLARRFGADRVFIDIDAIAPGTDFVVALDRALGDTKVVLVMIGRQWLATNALGTRRLDDVNDFVRKEIETALKRGTLVLPVLVQNVPMPTATELPEALAPLASRQAMSIQHEEFNDDAARLANAIARLVDPPVTRWRRPALIGGAVAALALIGFAAMHWTRAGESSVTAGADSTRVAQQKQVDDIVRVALEQRERGQYADAMTTLERATTVTGADTSRARVAQQDVAMEWVRELKVGEGQTFTDAMKTPLAVLDQSAPFATGARQGDLLAHIGWATFLRWRDGNRALKPADVYKRALAADPQNPYANVMLGHWLLSYNHGLHNLDSARPLFRVAVDARRETKVVRALQLAALRNDHSVESNIESVRVVDEMRRRGESKDPIDLGNVWANYYFALNDDGALSSSVLLKVLPPTEHLLTLQWAFDEFTRGDDARRQQLRYYVARLRAESGEIVVARDSLQALKAELARSPGQLQDAVDRALADLKARVPR